MPIADTRLACVNTLASAPYSPRRLRDGSGTFLLPLLLAILACTLSEFAAFSLLRRRESTWHFLSIVIVKRLNVLIVAATLERLFEMPARSLGCVSAPSSAAALGARRSEASHSLQPLRSIHHAGG
jgi:hypothetical protein